MPKPDDGDEGGAGGEVAIGEDGQVHDRILGGQLSDQEAGQRADGHEAHRHDQRGVEPVFPFAAVQHELQAPEARHHEAEAPPVDASGLAQIGRVEEKGAGHEEAEHAHRQVDVEDPSPRPLIRQVPAHRRTEDGPQNEAHSPYRHGEAPLVEREDLPEDGLRERDDGAPTEPLEDARDDQGGEVGRGAGQERARHEEHGADQKEALAPEYPHQPAGGGDHHGVSGEIRGDHPGHFIQPGRQGALEVRQDHVGDARVQDLHEGHHHDGEGDGPLPRGGDRGAIRGWRRHAWLGPLR